jgi:hypothetical protein
MMTVDNISDACVNENSGFFEAFEALDALDALDEALKFWSTIR